MAWEYQITDSLGVLTTAQQQNNAKAFYTYFKGYMTLEAMAGILGNIQRESQLNPGQQESGYGGSTSYGHGLIQWTPGSILVDWCNEQGLNWYNGDAQCYRIKCEGEATNGCSGYWLPTSSYPYSWSEFCKLTNVAEATKSYLAERERAGVSALDERLANANNWYSFLSGLSGDTYKPRLDSSGMEGSKYYYSDNPFYQAGYGLPNCTCYAWGRQYELTDEKPTQLSLGDAGEWYPYALSIGDDVGQTPKLGAVLCMTYEPSGHVAIVEQINSDGSIVISQSAYQGNFFWTETVYKENNYLPEWALSKSGIQFQGFIYLDKEFNPDPDEPDEPDKPIIFKKRKGYNFILFNRNRRNFNQWKSRKY